MLNLYNLGNTSLSIIDIDIYLQQHESIYQDFTSKNGLQYLNDCEELAQIDNFQYYYQRVRKFGALRKLQKSGIDISHIFNENLMDAAKEREMYEKFDAMGIEDIFQSINKNISTIEYEYATVGRGSSRADDDISELVESLKETPEIGANLMGKVFNMVTRGARKGKFYLNSGSTGSGKSRDMIGNACMLSYPLRYEPHLKTWMKYGSDEKSLIVTTELEKSEVQTVILAYLSGINEEKILYGDYNDEEAEIIKQAIDVMEGYPNIYIEQIQDPDVGQLKTIVKKHKIQNNIDNLFYDYISTSNSLLTEYKQVGLRTDEMLTLLSTALKDLGTELGIFVLSATQLSGDYDNWQGIRNQTLIRGAKAIADKIDAGYITMPVSAYDLAQLAPALSKLNMPQPTHVRDIYKMRRGRYKNVRIWSIFDLGTARMEDLFMTDGNYKAIELTIVTPVFDNLIEFNKVVEDVKDEIPVPVQQLTERPSPRNEGWDL